MPPRSTRSLIYLSFPISNLFRAAPLKLVLLPNAQQTGAVCLDGTPGGFYYAPAQNAADSDKWQLFFEVRPFQRYSVVCQGTCHDPFPSPRPSLCSLSPAGRRLVHLPRELPWPQQD